MNKQNMKISYDKESEVLSIEIKRRKSVDSDIAGNVVIDYDKKGEAVRVNLYNFSFDLFRDNAKFFKNFTSGFKLPSLVR
ncbi:MAG: hypothetical protein US18_C0046G0007 [Parcubacteria group bacterium GW2011_GWB1_36_5]|nr:MAG: hypothetical protein US12_C0043G0007 [Parcubacteria group bacterium GW2011_GWA2_36_24]KKQ06164.1 MAG: hypothetical protein US18_C0046G0007 [Parcubacteria group bacterium GW2011_GWB1_36_5]